ncbi:hypothetical protein [Nannocystis bainbridge]|uniref:Uncharacterized protein n=1 Tax=Nannocystis bainbridge TaxID=2995303 RepID=A0ABT5DSX3_9BACT|nr:hypothetical protein [Nannocystis bainbridge]MDC0716723.1 hypothetical protein [Nannocystis bainbridge]
MDGIDQYDRLDSREELDARLELLRQAHTEGAALEAKLEGWPAEVKAIVKGPDREEFLDGEREGGSSWRSTSRGDPRGAVCITPRRFAAAVMLIVL